MATQERERRPDDQERRVARGAAAAPPQHPLLHLQQAAGNRAVTAMLQRYDAYEHAKEGDKAAGSQSVKVGTETLTSGEINALADLYGSPADLMKADPKEISALVALVRRQVKGGRVEEAEWDQASGGRYNQLNLKNSPHFGPRNAGVIAPPAGAPATGPDNLSTFTRFYNETVQAIQDSHAAADAAKKKEALDKSVVTAGFAEHYILDAFSAGHLFNKDDFIAQLKANLDKLPAAQLSALFNSIAKGVLADKASHDLLDQYETVDRHYGFHPNFSREEAFQGLLEELYKDADGGCSAGTARSTRVRTRSALSSRPSSRSAQSCRATRAAARARSTARRTSRRSPTCFRSRPRPRPRWSPSSSTRSPTARRPGRAPRSSGS